MYVTRPLSLLRRSPELVTMSPNKEGPNSGYLVIYDEECETTTCLGLCKERSIRELPFPQNKDLTISYETGVGDDRRTDYDSVVFIPAINQPLSSNRYYVIRRNGKHKGEASVSSKEEDKGTCCCFTYIRDVKPRPLDPSDIYQQIEITKKKGRGFTASSVAQDGFPPLFLRRKYWHLAMSSPRNYHLLDDAPGLDISLRAKLPELSFFPRSSSSRTVLVGKWYVPFVFVKEDFGKLRDQMKQSMFYEAWLEQRWERIFACENEGRSEVYVDVAVEREESFVDGERVVFDWGFEENEMRWFVRRGKLGDESSRVLGLSGLVVERLKWEQERVGFSVGNGELKREVKVKRNEVFGGKSSEWKCFGCYVLVERFVLKRMNGSVLLTFDFKHTNQIRCKWE